MLLTAVETENGPKTCHDCSVNSNCDKKGKQNFFFFDDGRVDFDRMTFY